MDRIESERRRMKNVLVLNVFNSNFILCIKPIDFDAIYNHRLMKLVLCARKYIVVISR